MTRALLLTVAGLLLVAATGLAIVEEAHAPTAPTRGTSTTTREPTLPEVILTAEGPMRVEEDYLPGVVDCELAHFTEAPAALEAQAIAARTYLARYLAINGPAALVPIGPQFQCWRRPTHFASIQAAHTTAGVVLRYVGRLANGNFAAGTSALDDDCQPAPPSAAGYLDQPSWDAMRDAWIGGARFAHVGWTQIFVTDNRHRMGRDVVGTVLGNWGEPNRGALGQRAAICLAEKLGYDTASILRYFYGDDIEIGG